MTLTRTLLATCVLFGILPSVTPFGSASSGQRIFVGTPSKPIKRFVNECMTPREEMKLLTPQTSVDEAIYMLLDNGISGAPVIDPDTKKLVGIVSSSDFMLKDYAGAVLDMEGSSEKIESFVSLAKKIVGTTVGELMSPKMATIKSNEPMAKAADIMARSYVHRLIVVDPVQDKFVGILTRADVMRDVLSTVQAALPERATIDTETEDPGKFKP